MQEKFPECLSETEMDVKSDLKFDSLDIYSLIEYFQMLTGVKMSSTALEELKANPHSFRFVSTDLRVSIVCVDNRATQPNLFTYSIYSWWRPPWSTWTWSNIAARWCCTQKRSKVKVARLVGYSRLRMRSSVKHKHVLRTAWWRCFIGANCCTTWPWDILTRVCWFDRATLIDCRGWFPTRGISCRSHPKMEKSN